MPPRRRAADRPQADESTLPLPFAQGPVRADAPAPAATPPSLSRPPTTPTTATPTRTAASAGKASSDLELGLDEAGRGPILGPMVLACVALREADSDRLRTLGVCDSKRFGAGPAAHRARLLLAEQIQDIAAHVGVAVIAPQEIDLRRGQLNHLEREHAARLIDAAPPCARIFADGARLFAPMAARYPQLVAQDRAESAFVAVAAASIIAKTKRDTLWLAICERYHAEFGSYLEGHAGGGYPNEATRRFLRAYYSRYRHLPPETRTTWPTEFLADL